MIIVDKGLEKLEKDGKPVRAAIVGAGFMAQGLALQIVKFTPGIRLVGVANRTVENGKKVLLEADIDSSSIVILNSGEENPKSQILNPKQFQNSNDQKTKQAVDTIISEGKYVVTSEPGLFCRSNSVDVIIEMTGSLDYGARVVMEAIKNKKHVVSFNAELDGTVGPILKHYADKAGVIYTLADGDQPGVTMNLYRFVTGIGLKPVLCGNIKGLHDPYRNPTTQEGFAKQWRQRPTMVTSFADGTKISFEQAVVANATGMRVGKRGMNGPTVETGTRIEEIAKYFPEKDLESEAGIVDYVVGAFPPGGIFVLAKALDEKQKHYLNYYKMGEGPYYCFYVPYHLCHFEIPASIVRAVIYRDETLASIGRPMVEVVSIAKKDLKKGETIDKLGGYTVYGVCENYDTARKENLLPIGLSEGSELARDVDRDSALTFADVRFDEEKFVYKLWKEQLEKFSVEK
jgi:predicted homoserine dehydrogenase-like protein